MEIQTIDPAEFQARSQEIDSLLAKREKAQSSAVTEMCNRLQSQVDEMAEEREAHQADLKRQILEFKAEIDARPEVSPTPTTSPRSFPWTTFLAGLGVGIATMAIASNFVG